MQHDFSIVFDTENPLWNRVLEIFEKNEKYEKKVVSNRNLHHKFPRSFSKKIGEPVDNDKDNLISLSLAEHFLVHYYYYLLARKGFKQPMSVAFRLMARQCMKYVTPETAESMAKDYEDAVVISKKYISTVMKGVGHPQTTETKDKIRNTQLGKPHPHKGSKRTDATRQKLSDAKKGKSTWAKGRKWKMINGKRTYYSEDEQLNNNINNNVELNIAD